MTMRIRCMLAVAGGPSRRVGPGGLWIGRQPDCDFVLDDAHASRRHALVRVVADGVEVVPLGRSPVLVNGKRYSAPHALGNGDELRVLDLVLTVEVSAEAPRVGGTQTFVLTRGASRFGVTHTPFLIGGGEDDDLIVKRWPVHALAFHVAQGELYLEVRAGTAARNAEQVTAESMALLATGDVIAYRGEEFGVAAAGPQMATTAVKAQLGGADPPHAAFEQAPIGVSIEILPHGGRVVFRLADGEHPVYFADRRFDLLVALLQPPRGFQSGEPIPDDVVRSVVWPRRASVSRNQINTLISRCRRDLLEAGLAGPRLLERTPGGGATRFVLAADARVVVKS